MYFVVDELVFQEDIHEKLEKMIDSVVDEISNLYRIEKDVEVDMVYEFMSRVLDIRREQIWSETYNTWETYRYSLVLVSGGPFLEITTDGYIYAHWGDDYIEVKINDIDVLKNLERLSLALDVILNDQS